QITPESQQNYVVGGKRTISIRNTLGNCQCLQAVIYKPSFGGQFVFAADDKDHGLNYSPDNKEVSFEVDATNFQAGAGEIELRTYGGEAQKLPLKLYPLPPNITGLKMNKGDREGIISGDRLEQITSLKINGRRATVVSSQNSASFPSGQSSYGSGNTVNSANSVNSPTVNFVPNLSTGNPKERVFVFEDANARITENTAVLELGLEDNRTFEVKQTFPVALSRPLIVANENREIEGTVMDNGQLKMENASPKVLSIIQTRKKNNGETGAPKTKSPQLSIVNYPLSIKDTFPVETKEISLNVQNALTDYDFRVENLSLETRLEKSSSSGNNNGYGNPNFNPNFNNNGINVPLPTASFEILDWKNLRITIQISEQLQKLLGGRRLQFRIRDKERGDSDWYSIKQTFVRVPQITSINCTTEMNGMCELKGASIDYISQVSIDGGQSWYPQNPTTLQVQPTQDGQKLVMIPLLTNKKLLMVKLRDFPKGEGVFINGFSFSNTAKITKPAVQPNPPNQVNQPNPNFNPGQSPPTKIKTQPGKSPIKPPK
ncbi:MAG TPA: hypothetical protein PKY82_06165, partial [Pyrinomonadaceae bacterium]|nr:hypothetical protein [Pyrinomonadaceae bacterium]